MNLAFIHPKTIFLAALFATVFLLALYVWQVNAIIGQVYSRDSLSRQIEELKVQATDLSISRSKIEALDNIENRISELSSFGPVDRVSYIKVLEGIVVKSNEELAP